MRRSVTFALVTTVHGALSLGGVVASVSLATGAAFQRPGPALLSWLVPRVTEFLIMPVAYGAFLFMRPPFRVSDPLVFAAVLGNSLLWAMTAVLLQRWWKTWVRLVRGCGWKVTLVIALLVGSVIATKTYLGHRERAEFLEMCGRLCLAKRAAACELECDELRLEPDEMRVVHVTDRTSEVAIGCAPPAGKQWFECYAILKAEDLNRTLFARALPSNSDEPLSAPESTAWERSDGTGVLGLKPEERVQLRLSSGAADVVLLRFEHDTR